MKIKATPQKDCEVNVKLSVEEANALLHATEGVHDGILKNIYTNLREELGYDA